MEELKMNRSEIFNFVLRRCLYFTWCNNLFLNDAKVLPEISLHIYHAIGPVRKQKLRGWYDSNLTVQIQFKSDDLSTFIVSHIIFHNSRYRYAKMHAAVSCMERYEKMLKPFFLYFQNMNCLFTVLSCEYKKGSLIYFMFDLCGLELPAINDAPVKPCILFRSFRFDGNSFKLVSG